MVYLIGASSLYRAFNSSPYSLRSTIYKKSTAIPGLSLNPNSNNRLKDLGFLLERGQLRDRSDLVCWHDVIKNSITEHKSNGNKALTVEQLLHILKKIPKSLLLSSTAKDSALQTFSKNCER